MIPPISSLPASLFSRLVHHLDGFTARQREVMAELYGAPGSEAEELADFWVRNPEMVVEVVRRELKSSVGWRLIEEAVIEHDTLIYVDWTSAALRRMVTRLGVLNPERDELGHFQATMPGALAAFFADRVTGQRGSLPILLGRSPEPKVTELAARWDLSTQGSKIEKILRICDFFNHSEMIEDILDELPSPDWIGDVLMVMELGGVCYWQQIYGYDLEESMHPGENIVPLMRRDERAQQQALAEALMELGVLFRLELEGMEYPMVAVPEELWYGLWRLGRRWLMDWTAQSGMVLREQGVYRPDATRPLGAHGALKWWLCEARQGRLRWTHEDGVDPESRRQLEKIYLGDEEIQWDAWWVLGQELRLLEPRADGGVEPGSEVEALLDRRRKDFVGEVLLEWCLGYSGGAADASLGTAIGLDDVWRQRAMKLMEKQSELVPQWMHIPGIDPSETGGGWLRESGTGPDEIVLFEAGLTTAFVMMTKMGWLDLMSLAEGGRYYPMSALVELFQCVAGLSMFTQLGMVLEEQPAAVYLPFQRASFLMDQLHQAKFREWVGDIVDRLFVPLGIASYGDDGESIWLDTAPLRIKDPPGWPPQQRRNLLLEIFGEEVDFELPTNGVSRIRQVTPAPTNGENRRLIEEPISELLDAAEKEGEILSFDGRFIEFA